MIMTLQFLMNTNHFKQVCRFHLVFLTKLFDVIILSANQKLDLFRSVVVGHVTVPETRHSLPSLK